MRLPIPPIYVGAKGDTALILPDSFAVQNAPDGTIDALIEAAETVL